ncbi:MAG: D-cysteine desulfhydrase family protein [Porticoccaceae bacterium]|nr:D-cysteine desulfhydrase family protein [Porticoccaceae bacterium]
MIAYPDKLDLAQTPTPFYPLERLSAQLKELNGARIWIKRDDLTGAATSGNKIRKLEFLLAEALANGCDTVITSGGVQSNHCRAVALLGAQLGLNVHLLLRSDTEPQPVGNLLLDHLAGATINHYSPAEFKRLDSLFKHWTDHYQQQGSKAYSIPTGGSNGTGIWGYIRAAEELAADFARHSLNPQAIVHATGSGGTQAGLMLGCYMHGIQTAVKAYAVCDNSAYFVHKINADLKDWKRRYPSEIDISSLKAAATCDDYIGPGYGQAGPEVFEFIKQLAALEGILLDPVYTGKAFFGLVEDIKKGKYANDESRDIVFVHTGGLFGLFAQQQNLGY